MTVEHTCPRDGSVLESNAVGSAEVFVCGTCHGLWISGYDMASLMRAPYESWKLPWVEMFESGLKYVEDTVPCLCAEHSPMKTVTRDGIRVDLCPECGGLWFDGGELEELIRRRGEKEVRGPEDALFDGNNALMGLDLLLDVLLWFFHPP